jgi:hypothetical protein
MSFMVIWYTLWPFALISFVIFSPFLYIVMVRIQKPVVTYDPRKFSVTSRARLPNYLKINFKIEFLYLFKTTF